MGTRHLTIVYKDGTHRVAQYGQWDGYPSGAGYSILTFLRKKKVVEALRRNVSRTKFAPDDELEAIWNEAEARAKRDGADNWNWPKQYLPKFTRDTGNGILSIIAEDESDDEILLGDTLEFAGDGLFCEWVWVIDFDKNTFECYEGFQKEPNTDRFASLFKPNEPYPNGNMPDTQYYPAKLKASWPLDKLPTKREFLKQTERD